VGFSLKPRSLGRLEETMRLVVIPQDRLLALGSGCPGFLDALVGEVEPHDDAVVRVLRVASSIGKPRWYVSVGTRVLQLDSQNVEAMAAAVPIYLVDLVHELHEELSAVMSKPGMMEGVEKLIPFIRTLKKDEPS